jgi:hypothetical protein
MRDRVVKTVDVSWRDIVGSQRLGARLEVGFWVPRISPHLGAWSVQLG